MEMRRKLIPLALGIGAITRAPLAAELAFDLKLSRTLTISVEKEQAARRLPRTGLQLRLAESLSVQALRMPAPVTDPAHAALLAQARLWHSRNRDDLAAEALNKLLSSAPGDPDALAQLAFLHMRNNRKDEAKQLLERLRRIQPGHPDIAKLDTLIRLDESDKDRMRQARMLARAGKTEEALAALASLYPAGPPTGDHALEYWQLVADTPTGWSRAQAELQRLVAEYPDNQRYRLALAEHITSRRPNDPAALRTIQDLARIAQFEKPARAAWRRAMLRLGPSRASIPLIEDYLAHESVEDAAAKEHLAGIRQAIEQQRRLLADPFYRARLDGLELLDAGNLDEADERLAYAVGGRPEDPDVLGGLGLLRLRQGHHAEAYGYFLQAQRRTRNASRWATLLRTAQFWGLMREASDAVDAGEYPLAESKLVEARGLDPREAAAVVAQARIHVAQGRVDDAEKVFREAIALEPRNANAMQGLALLYLRTGREDALEGVLAHAAPVQRKVLAEAVASARAAQLKEKAEALLARGETVQAIEALERAISYDRVDPWLRYDLARLYASRQEAGKGEALFDDLFTRHPDDAAGRYAYALFQSSRDLRVAALTTLERIAFASRNEGMTSLQRRLWISLVIRSALAEHGNGRNEAARRLLDHAEQHLGHDAELLLDIADARIDIGDIAHAHSVLVRLMESSPTSVDWSLRHARLLAAAGGDDLVAPLVDDMAARPLNAQQGLALGELKIDGAIRHAGELRRAGRAEEALQVLASSRQAYPENDRLLAAEARQLRSAGHPEKALDAYRQLHARRPATDNAIALAEALAELHQFDEARHLADRLVAESATLTADQTADLIAILLALQDDAEAQRLISHALEKTPDSPRVLSLAGRLAQKEGRHEDAISLLQRSLASALSQRRRTSPAGVSELLALQGEDTTPHLDIHAAPASAVAAEAGVAGNYRRMAEWMDQGSAWFAAALDYRSRSGAEGTSQYALMEVPLERQQALTRDGRWTYRADLVSVRAGRMDLAADNAFGSAHLCQPACTDVLNQSAQGVSLNAALERDGTRYDVGTTPLGFPVRTLVGGMLRKGDWGPFGYSVDVSRRPLTGSLLSYAGTRDPRTGQVWGGVQANGVRFGLSLDEGGRYGGWSSLGLHRLSGKNVKDNNRMQLMAGAVMRLVNEDDRLFQVGVTGMHWRMSDNAGEYTFGHGGYYSPGRYSSLSLPLTFGKRFARFSYAVRASVSASRSQARTAPYFPTNAAMQSEAERLALAGGVAPFYTGGPGSGVGRSLSLAWEYQADARMFLGGRLELDRSPDYSPNRFLFYLRYAVDRASARPVNFLPEAVNPTSQY